jgi:hypothetical protein
MDQRQIFLKERVKAAVDRKRMPKSRRARKGKYYHIPFGVQGQSDMSVCVNSFRNMFGVFRKPWTTLKRNVFGAYVPGPIIHGNTGNRHRELSSNAAVTEESIAAFLTDLAQTYAEPYATRFVRSVTSVGLRNSEVDCVELPSNFRKRQLYRQWCFNMGYIVKSDHNGNYGSTQNFALRPHDDLLWPEGTEPSPVSSWHSFRQAWKKRLPHLKIRKACEDVCGECVRFRNAVAHAQDKRDQRNNRHIAAVAHDSSNSDESNLSSASDISSATEEAAYEAGLADWPEEYIFSKANDHVTQARSQRELVGLREEEATASRNHAHCDRSFCLVADYCQNLSLPHFGSEQPGDTYYYSPLFIYVFGVADVSSDRPKLFSYGYHEGQGSKGGNNVASLLMKAMTDLGWLIPGECGGRLSIVMDNCGGQNKNKMVLRLALYLVEKKLFKCVEFIFYIRGHTKNVCDRLFNLLKINYSKANVYTMEMLTDVCNSMEDITFIPLQGNEFFNYDQLLDEFYKPFKPGTVQVNHYFMVNHHSPTTMVTKQFFDDDEEQHFQFKNNVLGDNRDAELTRRLPNVIPSSGIKAIKQVELFKKWRQYVPVQFRDSICPKPPDDVLESVRVDRNLRLQQRRRSD